MSVKNGKVGELSPETIANALSLYDQIMQFDDLARESVVIPEWGGATVIVRTMTAEERDAYELWAAQQTKGDDGERHPERLRNIRAKIATLCVIDEAGKNLFTENDVERLGRKSAKALDRIYTVADRLSSLSDSAQTAVLGNSETTSSDASPSD